MRKKIKSFLVICLCFCLCVNIVIPAYASNESNNQGVTFSATLDTPTIQTSDEDQTVTMYINANNANDNNVVLVDSITAKIVYPDQLAIVAVKNYENPTIDFTSSGDSNVFFWGGTEESTAFF